MGDARHAYRKDTIIRAIQTYNAKNPTEPVVIADCGYFVSDYVGEQALREYSKVYRLYPTVLSAFLKQTLNLQG
jgi:hypothetical protein